MSLADGPWPQYWIAKPHPHWDTARNRRFRVFRIDGPKDWLDGRHPGAVWDAEERRWHTQPWGIIYPWLDRPAAPDEFPQEPLL